MTYTIHIRRGRLVIDDPQRRCYNGCYFASHMEWSDWNHGCKMIFMLPEKQQNIQLDYLNGMTNSLKLWR